MARDKKTQSSGTKVGKSTLQASDFVHLHNHTQYSLLDGLTKIGPLVDFVKNRGMPAVAITDHGTLSGVIEFYKTAKSGGVKPVIGIETYVASRKHTDKEPSKDRARHHLILLAMNYQGYLNLMKLSSLANIDGFYYYPRIDHDLLKKYKEGLIVLSGCMGGEVGSALQEGQYDHAKKTASWYKKVFGDRYYLEVQDHGHPDNPLPNPEQQKINNKILKLGKELDIKCVVTSDAHYLYHEDQDAHEILLCVGTTSFLSDEKRMSLKDFPLHVTDPMEIIGRWGKSNPELITNTKDIADRCDVEIELGQILIPKFSVEKGLTEKSSLENQVWRGVAWRYGGEDYSNKLTKDDVVKILPKNVIERVDYELTTIDRMGFNSYFLIVSDFINWAKDQGIVFGPGRGSAAGSIVAYSTRITEIDPIKFDLLFERFLNPDRVSMPDIDIDIQDNRRDEVIQYCIDKYGSDKVANIVTFGRMAARAAIRDVARVLEVPYADADRLAKMIPPPVQGRHIPLSKSIVKDTDLKKEYETNPRSKEVMDQAIRLEGTIRSHGVHAAGVVIAPDIITNYVPLEMAQKGVLTTQYSMGPIEDIGLLKMDFLGLSNLTIIKNALRIIKKAYSIDINIIDLPLDDALTYELLQRGDTTGVFQLESAGMKRYLKELKPTVFDDIIAMVALYRPGPIQWIDDFIARKHGDKKIEYLHGSMESALSNTYGIIVYQEQVMQISKEMCGFTGGQADTLRKAIGKKKPEELAKMKTAFIEGALRTVKTDKMLMETFWAQLEAFAAYCFPKAHAACYALIAYQTAYLKANYPSAFMAALMTSDYDDTDRLAIEIDECLSMGIEVLPPDVNESFHEFAVVSNGEDRKAPIRFGLDAIKNVGHGAVEEIIRARSSTEGGKFAVLESYFSEVNARVVNRKNIESLIKTGAFDRYGDRYILLFNIDNMLSYANKIQKDALSGQIDLFGGSTEELHKPKIRLTNPDEAPSPREQLKWERDLLGIYLSQHPLDHFNSLLKEETQPLSSLHASMEGKTVTVGGVIVSIREITTKNGQKMAFIGIADLEGDIELIIFPKVYKESSHAWQRDHVVIVNGKVSAKDKDGKSNESLKILVDDVREITYEQASSKHPLQSHNDGVSENRKVVNQLSKVGLPSISSVTQRLYIRLESADDQTKLVGIKRVIDDAQGETEVVLIVGPSNSKQAIKLPLRIDPLEEHMEKLADVIGAENIKLY